MQHFFLNQSVTVLKRQLLQVKNVVKTYHQENRVTETMTTLRCGWIKFRNCSPSILFMLVSRAWKDLETRAISLC